MTSQVTRIAIAHSGQKPPDYEIEDFMPIKEILAADDPRLVMANYLGKETQVIFDELIVASDVNPYMVKAFRDNELISKALVVLRTQSSE